MILIFSGFSSEHRFGRQSLFEYIARWLEACARYQRSHQRPFLLISGWFLRNYLISSEVASTRLSLYDFFWVWFRNRIHPTPWTRRPQKWCATTWLSLRLLSSAHSVETCRGQEATGGTSRDIPDEDSNGVLRRDDNTLTQQLPEGAYSLSRAFPSFSWKDSAEGDRGWMAGLGPHSLVGFAGRRKSAIMHSDCAWLLITLFGTSTTWIQSAILG